jgi:hypothetical protein
VAENFGFPDSPSFPTHALETDRTLGGNAKWLEIKNVVTDDGNLDPRAGFVMEVEIVYVTEGVTP